MAKLTFARAISLLGHPFTLATYLALTPCWTPGGHPAAALRTTAVVLAIAVLPLTLFVRRRRATGQWQTVDASHPDDRPALFRASFAALLPLAACLLLAVAAFLNRRIKLSLHLAFATFATLSLLPLGPAHYLPLACLLPFLAWSRLALRRHTPAELLAGLLLGALTGPLALP